VTSGIKNSIIDGFVQPVATRSASHRDLAAMFDRSSGNFCISLACTFDAGVEPQSCDVASLASIRLVLSSDDDIGVGICNSFETRSLVSDRHAS
jgi:hypothetical protein